MLRATAKLHIAPTRLPKIATQYQFTVMLRFSFVIRSDRMTSFHELEMTKITGEPLSFKQYKGQICLVVNVASQ